MKRFFKKALKVVGVVVTAVSAVAVSVAPWLAAGTVVWAFGTAGVAGGMMPFVAWLLAAMVGIFVLGVLSRMALVLLSVLTAGLAEMLA